MKNLVPTTLMLVAGMWSGLFLSCSKGQSSANGSMLDLGKEVYELQANSTMDVKTKTKKIADRKFYLDMKFPLSVPVSRDSMAKSFLPTPPAKIDNFIYRVPDPVTTIIEKDDNSYLVKCGYTNYPNMYASDEIEDKFIIIEMIVDDLAITSEWQRATDWYYLEHGLSNPNNYQKESQQEKRPNVTDSKGRTWVRRFIKGTPESTYSQDSYTTLVNNRYAVTLTANFSNIDRPEYKQYYTKSLVTPDFFYKAADMNWIEKLPK